MTRFLSASAIIVAFSLLFGMVALAETGRASWYGRTGNPTANGEYYDGSGMTAAHRTLPFGTRVRVTALDSGKAVTVRINDRGPFVRGRIVDLSRAAATQLGIRHRGTARVHLEVLR